jgi:hypothetical protein
VRRIESIDMSSACARELVHVEALDGEQSVLDTSVRALAAPAISPPSRTSSTIKNSAPRGFDVFVHDRTTMRRLERLADQARARSVPRRIGKHRAAPERWSTTPPRRREKGAR